MTDLHVHSIYSDGNKTVPEILREAEALGLKSLSITDHNTMAAYKELENPEVRKLFSGEIIPGIEIDYGYLGTGTEATHLLGFNVDPQKMMKVPFLSPERRAQEIEFFKKVHAYYKDLGCELAPVENLVKILETQIGFPIAKLVGSMVKENLEKTKAVFKQHNIDGRKHLAKLMKDPRFGYPKPPTLEEVSKAIGLAKGKVFHAHPYKLGDKMYEVLDYAVENELIHGIEVWRNNHTPQETEELEAYARKNELLMSGGSDCHHRKPKDKIGQLDTKHKWQNQWLKSCQELQAYNTT